MSRAIFILLTWCLAAHAVAQSSLIVDVDFGLRTAEGTLRVALCPNKTAYSSEKGCLLREARVQAPTTHVEFERLGQGTYALKLFLDVNDNGVLDTNWMGIPNEPYGFGNDAIGTFGPPSFEQAGIEIGGGATVTRVKLKG